MSVILYFTQGYVKRLKWPVFGLFGVRQKRNRVSLFFFDSKIWISPRAFFLKSKMTAIAIVYTPEGFAAAADGQARWGDDSTADGITKLQEADSAQKLFPVEDEQKKFIFAVMGMAFNKDGSFSVITEIQKAIAKLATRTFGNFYNYVDEVCRNVKKSILAAKKDGRIEKWSENKNADPGDELLIVRVYFIGYFQGKPHWLQARFLRHKDNPEKVRLVICPETLAHGRQECRGFAQAASLAVNGDARFSQYREALAQDMGSLTLARATQFVKAFIDISCDPVAAQLDPETSKLFGGHVHVIAVTPDKLEWIQKPK